MFISVLIWMSISTYVHINITNFYMEKWNSNYVCVNSCSNGSDFLFFIVCSYLEIIVSIKSIFLNVLGTVV